MVAAEVPALDPRQRVGVKRSRERTNRPTATWALVRPALDADPAQLAAVPTMEMEGRGDNPLPSKPRPSEPLPVRPPSLLLADATGSRPSPPRSPDDQLAGGTHG